MDHALKPWFPENSPLRFVVDMVLLALFIAFVVLWIGRVKSLSIEQVLPHALVSLFGILTYSIMFGIGVHDVNRHAFRTVTIFAVSFLLAVSASYGMIDAVEQQVVWRNEIGITLLFTLSLMVMMRIRSHAFGAGFGNPRLRRVMVLGTGTDAVAVEKSLRQSGSHVRIVGFYPVHSEGVTHVAHDLVLAGSQSLVATARILDVHEVIVAVRDRRVNDIPLLDLLDCKLAGVRILDLSSYFERALGQIRLDSLRASWLIFGEGFRQGLLRKGNKRFFDISAAIILLLFLWPVMLLAACLIVLESGFPFLYRQQRVGEGGCLFDVIKFRSMYSNAEQGGTPVWAASNDSRVTRVGRVIRKLRIDELPQLHNVLKGDMSLCGPRPERPYFVDQLIRDIPFYAARHSVKPGITGWAQVRYHYGDSIKDAAQKLQYDLYYVKNHTLFLDALIMFRTVGVVLTGSGAR